MQEVKDEEISPDFSAILTLLVVTNIAVAQHYTDWSEFEYYYITENNSDDFAFYELARDYTINISDYFTDASKFPDCVVCGATELRNRAMALPDIDWDFIRVEPGGIFTVKKGFSWDGPSYPLREHSRFNIRSSMIHDAFYTLMRLGYLSPDKTSALCEDVPGSTDGDYNRQMADMMIYMISREDGQGNTGLQGAQADYMVLRKFAPCRTHRTKWIDSWQFHVSKLRGIGTDGKVELNWKAANYNQKDPDFGDHFNPILGYTIKRNGELLTILDSSATSYTDNSVVNGTVYKYQIVPFPDNKQKYDRTIDDEFVVPNAGPGNALLLDGVNDYVEANLVCNDLMFNKYYSPYRQKYTVEGWVYPDDQSDEKAVFTFNTIEGSYLIHLAYNGTTEKFVYWDTSLSNYVATAGTFPKKKWHHVALTIDDDHNNNAGILYVNGDSVAAFNSTVRPDYGSRFSIGQSWDRDVTSQHFKGMIDEVRIWRTTRTQAEIVDNMNRPLRGDEPDLTALWHFDEPSDLFVMTGYGVLPPLATRKIYDASANASNGTLRGVEFWEEPFVPSCAMNVECVTQVAIDIKPGSCPNPLNAKNKPGNGKSVLPVAILGTADFDVTEINIETISLEGVAPVRWSFEDVATPVDKSDDDCACTEEEGDGYDDLTLKFDRQEIIDAILNYNASDSASNRSNNRGKTLRTELRLRLTAMLSDSTEIQGYDCILFMTKDSSTGSAQQLPDVDPVKLTLHGNHPNPFNPTTQISFTLPTATKVQIDIFNLLGQRVETLVDRYMEAGFHSVSWDATRQASGIYFYRLQSNDVVETRKMILMK